MQMGTGLKPAEISRIFKLIDTEGKEKCPFDDFINRIHMYTKNIRYISHMYTKNIRYISFYFFVSVLSDLSEKVNFTSIKSYAF